MGSCTPLGVTLLALHRLPCPCPSLLFILNLPLSCTLNPAPSQNGMSPGISVNFRYLKIRFPLFPEENHLICALRKLHQWILPYLAQIL